MAEGRRHAMTRRRPILFGSWWLIGPFLGRERGERVRRVSLGILGTEHLIGFDRAGGLGYGLGHGTIGRGGGGGALWRRRRITERGEQQDIEGSGMTGEHVPRKSVSVLALAAGFVLTLAACAPARAQAPGPAVRCDGLRVRQALAQAGARPVLRPSESRTRPWSTPRAMSTCWTRRIGACRSSGRSDVR